MKTINAVLLLALFVITSAQAVTYQRTCSGTGTSVTCDIGSAGNNRLVVISLSEELDLGSYTVTVDGKSATLIDQNENYVNVTTEQWAIGEDTLGSSSGSVSVACGGDCSSSTHIGVIVFYDVDDTAKNDSGNANQSATTCSVSNIDVDADGVVILSGINTGTTSASSWTSPLTRERVP